MAALRYTLQRCEPDDTILRTYSDHVIFQTEAWLAFVQQTQRAEVVTADLLDGSSRRVGRFTGLMVRRMGVRILGSPLPGWTTSYMGFNLDPRVRRVDAMRALRRFAFEVLCCHHVEVTDRCAQVADLTGGGFRTESHTMSGYEVDLSGGPERVFASMKPGCRQNIRKAERVGVTIEAAENAAFANDYYAQLEDVFARQGLVPTYGITRVRALINHLMPTGRLLLLRAVDRDGACIATGVFPATNGTMYFWGGASWRHGQRLRPNEALQWHAMQYWMARGVSKYDMVGGGKYKERYGAYPIRVPSGRASRFEALEHLRNARKQLQMLQQRVRAGMTRFKNVGLGLTSLTAHRHQYWG